MATTKTSGSEPMTMATMPKNVRELLMRRLIGYFSGSLFSDGLMFLSEEALRSLAGDGRKVRAFVRGMVAAGYLDMAINKANANANANGVEQPRITMKLLGEWNAEPVDLVKEWEAAKEKDRFFTEHDEPVLPLDELTLDQQKWVLFNENEGLYQWRAINNECLGNSSRRHPKAHDIVDVSTDSTAANFRVRGGNAQLALARQLDALGQSYPQVKLVLTSKTLIAHVHQQRQDAITNGLIGRNLGWGLERLGLLPEEMALEVITEDESPTAWMSGHAHDNLGTDPNKWASRMASAIEYIHQDIEAKRKRLCALQAAQAKIDAMGGWDAFMTAYRSAVLASQGADATQG